MTSRSIVVPNKPGKARRSKPVRPARVAPPRAAAAPVREPGTSSSPFEATQGTTYVPLDPDIYRLIDRYAIKFGSDSLRDPHTSVRPYTRAGVAHLGERMLSRATAPRRTAPAAFRAPTASMPSTC